MIEQVHSKQLDSKFIRFASISALAVSILALILFGIVGLGRSGGHQNFAFDFRVMYDAGLQWRLGNNPYLNDNPATPFAYPPNTSILFIPFSFLTFDIARYGMLILNLASIANIIVVTFRAIKIQVKDKSQMKYLLAASFIIGNPFTMHSVYQGQTTLIVLAFLMWAWDLSSTENYIFAGICLGIASLKPQISILIFLWFLLQRCWQVLAVSAVTLSVMSSYAFLVQGPIGSTRSWLQDGIGGYLNSGANNSGFQHVVGIQSLLASADFDAPSLKWLGFVLVICLWKFQKKLNYSDLLGIILGISLTFVYGHDSDYVCLIPLLASLMIFSERRASIWLWLSLIVFLLIIPQRLVRLLDFSVINHWRTLVVIALTTKVFFISQCFQYDRRRKDDYSGISE